MKRIGLLILVIYAVVCSYIVYLYDQKYFKQINEMKQRIDEIIIEQNTQEEINVPATGEPF